MPALSMPLFVSPADVILRMQLGAELTGVDDVITSGIIGAQLHVQRIIDGQLTRRSWECMFYLDSTAFSGIQPDGVYRLEVPSGFIRDDTDVTITVSEESTTEAAASPFGTFEAIDMTVVKVDYDRGYILIDAASYKDVYVKVICDTGFEPGTNYTDDSPPVLIPQDPIPMELYEAIMSMVPVIFDNSQTTNRNAEAESQYRKAADHAAMLLQPYARTRGFSIRPMWRQ